MATAFELAGAEAETGNAALTPAEAPVARQAAPSRGPIADSFGSRVWVADRSPVPTVVPIPSREGSRAAFAAATSPFARASVQTAFTSVAHRSWAVTTAVAGS
jgi:hypothetical protein